MKMLGIQGELLHMHRGHDAFEAKAAVEGSHLAQRIGIDRLNRQCRFLDGIGTPFSRDDDLLDTLGVGTAGRRSCGALRKNKLWRERPSNTHGRPPLESIFFSCNPPQFLGLILRRQFQCGPRTSFDAFIPARNHAGSCAVYPPLLDQPPSTGRLMPVMKRDSSQARKSPA